MHAAKSMKNGSEWDGPFDLFNRYISRENMKEYDGPNRCYSSTAVVREAHVILVQKHLFAIYYTSKRALRLMENPETFVRPIGHCDTGATEVGSHQRELGTTKQ